VDDIGRKSWPETEVVVTDTGEPPTPPPTARDDAVALTVTEWIQLEKGSVLVDVTGNDAPADSTVVAASGALTALSTDTDVGSGVSLRLEPDGRLIGVAPSDARDLFELTKDETFEAVVTYRIEHPNREGTAEARATLTLQGENDAPFEISVSTLFQRFHLGTDTTTRVDVGTIFVDDIDPTGNDNRLTLEGAHSGLFELDGDTLFLKAGTDLSRFAPGDRLEVWVVVQDPTSNRPEHRLSTAEEQLFVDRIFDGFVLEKLGAPVARDDLFELTVTEYLALAEDGVIGDVLENDTPGFAFDVFGDLPEISLDTFTQVGPLSLRFGVEETVHAGPTSEEAAAALRALSPGETAEAAFTYRMGSSGYTEFT
jgi:hypothetical protein